MIIQLLYIIIFLTGFMGIIQLSELLYLKFKVNSEITRKIAHILGSLSSLSFLLLFKSHWYVLIIACAFFLLLLISKRKGIYKSIDLVERETIGSFMLPVSIYLLYLIFELTNNKLYFVLPVLILGISDPLAGLVGISNKGAKQIHILAYNFQKTYLGSLSFLFVTLMLTILTFYFFNFSSQNILLLGLFFAFVTTIVEMLSKRGLDNLTVPLVTALLIWISTF